MGPIPRITALWGFYSQNFAAGRSMCLPTHPPTYTVATKYDDEPEEVIDEITVRESDGWFVVRSTAHGVTSQGRTVNEALDNLVEAVELYHEDVPEGLDEELEPSNAPWF